jgi:DNA-binding winged helix-turn-helix (wHTH) protein
MATNSRPAATFRFGEFTFDCGSRQLLYGGVERHLSPKAQHLLQLLLVARPRVLSREELYDALWPSVFVCETNLACIINEVRRALSDDARASQYVRTVHGVGYSFCGEVASWPAGAFEVAVLGCEGRIYPLYEGENAVGRAPDGRVVILAPTVSRRHALITIQDGAISIMDLDSKNGTYVEGERIGRSPVRLMRGAQIGFGALIASISARRISSTRPLQTNQLQLRAAQGRGHS